MRLILCDHGNREAVVGECSKETFADATLKGAHRDAAEGAVREEDEIGIELVADHVVRLGGGLIVEER